MAYTYECIKKKHRFYTTLRVPNPKIYPCEKCWTKGVKEIKIKNKFATGLKYKGIGDA